MKPTLAVRYEDTLKRIEEMKAEGTFDDFERSMQDVLNPPEFGRLRAMEKDVTNTAPTLAGIPFRFDPSLAPLEIKIDWRKD